VQDKLSPLLDVEDQQMLLVANSTPVIQTLESAEKTTVDVLVSEILIAMTETDAPLIPVLPPPLLDNQTFVAMSKETAGLSSPTETVFPSLNKVSLKPSSQQTTQQQRAFI